MTIKQLSVFLENRPGRVNEVTRILGANCVNMHAFTVAGNADFGILHMIVSDVELAVRVLKEAQFTVKVTEVLYFTCPDTPGAMTTVLDYLVKEGVFIEYMYAFSQGETAAVVIRPTNIEKTIAIFDKYKYELISEKSICFNLKS